MEEVKLCIKCRYCKRTKATYYRHQYECLHPNRMIVNLVTGEQLTEFYCDTFRQFDIDCGKEGKWFSQKDNGIFSWFKKLFTFWKN